MEFRLLGRFEARHEGRPIPLGSRRQERCLLAILLLEAGRIVATERLADLLWDSDPPESARGTIHTYIGRLRGAFKRHGLRIDTSGDGYVVQADGHVIDTEEFAALTRRAADATDPAERVELYGRALSLWRGPLLADLADDRLRQRLDAQLGELRLSASELRAEAQLGMGFHDSVVADLTPLVARHPRRERLVRSLMTGLYRCGRQADALQLYRDTRQALVDDLGIEPGPELQALHEKVLRADPSLDRPAAPLYAVRVRDQWLPWQTSGHPALEFCNTYAGWHGPRLPGSEWLRGYTALAVWAGHMDLADEPTVTRLIKQAQRDPDDAAAVLDEARELRKKLYACLTDTSDAHAFEVVAGFGEAAAKMSVFARGEDGLGRWRLSSAAGLRLPVYAAARSATDLLADPRRFTVRVCPSSRCGWLFLDQSGLRRWCSIATCGSAREQAACRS